MRTSQPSNRWKVIQRCDSLVGNNDSQSFHCYKTISNITIILAYLQAYLDLPTKYKYFLKLFLKVLKVYT